MMEMKIYQWFIITLTKRDMLAPTNTIELLNDD